MDHLLVELTKIVGAQHVLTDPELMVPYVTDWTRRWRGDAQAVIRPGNTAEVSAVVRTCRDAGVSITVQGGNTGLVGGSVPARHSDDVAGVPLPVLVSTRRLTRLDEVDQLAGQVTVGAGVTLGDLHKHAGAAGWEYGVDLAARDSATVGGTVSTNAGGIRVIAYGMTRAQVRGIEAVLPDGEVIEHLGGLVKDNTGYDLAGLFTGSEGTLGIITAVRLSLVRPTAATSVALIGVSSFGQALHLLHTAIESEVSVLAAEITDRTGMRLAMEVATLAWPLTGDHQFVLLLEVADGGTGGGFIADALADCDVVIGIDASTKKRLWEYRERQSEAFSVHAAKTAGGIAHKLDISIPLQHLGECADELRDRMSRYPQVDTFGVFGHLGDGNLHVEITGPDADDESVDFEVLSVVAKYQGSVSAEHGIGRAKTKWLDTSRSTSEILAMRAIKQAWDQNNLMNPGVIFT